MRRLFLCVPFVAVACLLAGGLTLAQRATAETLFREALAKERAEGDLGGAIFRYERLIADFSAERQIAAQAMYQLSLVYEKLGDPRGRLLLARLAREYGDVEPYAGRARTRLSAVQSTPPGPFPRVALDADYELGSPDGALAVYHKSAQDWGRLYVRDLATGKERLLVDHPGTDVSNLAWSPDSRRLAFNGYERGKMHDLRTVDVATGAETSLGIRGYPLDWAESGDILFYLPNYSAGGRMDYSLVPAAGGTPRKVYSAAECCPLITPDGARLLVPKSKRYVVMEIATGKETPLTAFTGEESEAIFSPDGRLVSFAANQDGRWAFYVAPFGTSLPVKEPIKIADLDQAGPVASRWYSRQWWTRKGLLTFQVITSQVDLYRVDVDPKSGRAASAPLRLTQDAAQNWLPSVSPDSKRVAYWYQNGTRMGLAVMESSGANERPLFDQGLVLRADWYSPEEIFFLRQATKDGEPLSINSLNVNTGAARIAARVDGLYWRYVPNRNEILHVYPPGAKGERPAAVMKATSITDGKERVVATIENLATQIEVTRDGKRVAFATGQPGEKPGTMSCRLAEISLDGGPETVLLSGQPQMPWPLAWSPDGKFLLYYQQSVGTQVMNVQTRESWPLLTDDTKIERPALARSSWSPDGTFIVFEKLTATKTERLAWQGVTADAVAKLTARRSRTP
jgi:Tol biopolymer transport system component